MSDAGFQKQRKDPQANPPIRVLELSAMPFPPIPVIDRAGPGPSSYAIVSRPLSSHRGSNHGQGFFALDSRSNSAVYRGSPFPPSHASDSSDSSSSDDASSVTGLSSEAFAVIRFNDRSSPERLERNLSLESLTHSPHTPPRGTSSQI